MHAKRFAQQEKLCHSIFFPFLEALRAARIPVSITEFLAFLGVMRAGLAEYQAENLYVLARCTLVKDERHYDRFDRVFGTFFRNLTEAQIDTSGEVATVSLPREWLEAAAEALLSEEEKHAILAEGGWEELMRKLAERLAEQRERHQGGSKWIGTGGTSPFGAHGYNPAGIRIGQKSGRSGRAVKVWDQRNWRNLDDQTELGGRNIQLALRRLRRFAREGAADEFDLNKTIAATARNAGLLDIQLAPERRNAVRVLLFLDVGGSMDPYVRRCEELFSTARAEFRYLESFYFHNCIYEQVWRDIEQPRESAIATERILQLYGPQYRVIMVGDATMSPYEIDTPGGSVEQYNAESGAVWMSRIADRFPRVVWLNPQPEAVWGYHHSIGMMRNLVSDRMFPLHMRGLEDAMAALKR